MPREASMGDIGDYWNDARDYRRELRSRLGVSCPRCKEVRPKACASILLPGQRCKVDGYRDPRPRHDAKGADR
jgi:hypothetical protein